MDWMNIKRMISTMQFHINGQYILLTLLIIVVAANKSANAVDPPVKGTNTNGSVVVAPRHFQAAAEVSFNRINKNETNYKFRLGTVKSQIWTLTSALEAELQNCDQLSMIGDGPLVPQNRQIRQYGGAGTPQQFSGAMAQRGGGGGGYAGGGAGFGFQRQASFAHTGSGPQFGYGGGGGFPGAASGAGFNYRQPFQRGRSWWRWAH